MTIIRLMFIALAAAMLTACDPFAQVEKALTEPEKELAEESIQILATGDLEDILALFDEDFSDQMDEVWFREFQSYVPGPTIDSLRPYQANWTTSGRIPGVGNGKKLRESVVAYEWRSGDRYASVTLKLRTPEGEAPRLIAFNINHLPGPVDDYKAPDLSLATGGHYLFIALMISAVAITLFAVWRIWHSGRFRRRKLWTLGAVIGFGSFKLVWETGEAAFSLMSFHLLSAAFVKAGPYAPWVFSWSVPVFAIAAIVRSYYPEREQVTD